MALRKIISGGQTGADRAALEAARAWNVPVGGWVPAGREAEDGAIPAEFVELRETATRLPEERTRLNVQDSDGTLIISHGALTGGSALTLELAQQLQKPVLHIDLCQVPMPGAIRAVLSWLRSHPIEHLNVAGPRASEDAHAQRGTFAVVAGMLARLDEVDR
jgi:hypothetical protein